MAMVTQKLKVGDKIPDFKAKDFEGEETSRDDLLGSPFVMYFYPKDDTPGCTKEACAFRDVMDTFDELDFIVIGVSPDSPESHQQFMEKHDLNFPLLSDEKLDLSKKCGIVKEKSSPNGQTSASVERTTFICDEDGVIQWIESPVSIEGHVERIMKAIEEIFA